DFQHVDSKIRDRPRFFSAPLSREGGKRACERGSVFRKTWSVPVSSVSEADRLAVAARVARGEVAAVELPDELPAAELVVIVDGHDAVAAALQLVDDRRLKPAVLDAHVHALHEAKARPVAGGLRALPVVGNAHHDLRMA